MAGKRPFSSQAAKKNVQSMYGTSSASGTSTRRAPRNAGTGGGCDRSIRRRLASAWA